MQFVTIMGAVIRTDAVACVGSVPKRRPEEQPGWTIDLSVYFIGSANPVTFPGTRRAVVAARNKLLRAMGASNV